MEKLDKIVQKLDQFFGVQKLDKDPAMSRHLPRVYDSINFDWMRFFEADFVQRFNGFMIKGSDEVNTIFLGVFPSEEFLEKVFSQVQKGDMIFLHHPINMNCGDPKGGKGCGFLPISPETLKKIKDLDISVYACHAPIDYNTEIGTNEAIIEALHATTIESFYPYGNGYAGRICTIAPISTDDLMEKLKNIFGLPYVDFVGKKIDKITKIGIIAGCGGDLEYLEEMEKLGVQCGIAGEVTNKIDNDFGRNEKRKIEEYLPKTKIGFIGVSHAASEYLVMETQMKKFLEDNFDIKAYPISEKHWRR